MSKKTNTSLLPLGLLALGGAILYFGRTASTVSNLDYDFRAFRLVKPGFPITDAAGTLAINNPNPQRLVVRKLFLNISYAGSVIGTVKVDERRVVDGRSESLISFPISLRVAAIANRAFDILVLKRLQGVELKGSILVNGVNYPIQSIIDLG